MSTYDKEFKKIIDSNFAAEPGWRAEPGQEFGPWGAMDRVDEVDDFVPAPVPRVRLSWSLLTVGVGLVMVGVVSGIVGWVFQVPDVASLVGFVFVVAGLVCVLLPALRRRGHPDEQEPQL